MNFSGERSRRNYEGKITFYLKPSQQYNWTGFFTLMNITKSGIAIYKIFLFLYNIQEPNKNMKTKQTNKQTKQKQPSHSR
jgi:hypothetical protein